MTSDRRSTIPTELLSRWVQGNAVAEHFPYPLRNTQRRRWKHIADKGMLDTLPVVPATDPISFNLPATQI